MADVAGTSAGLAPRSPRSVLPVSSRSRTSVLIAPRPPVSRPAAADISAERDPLTGVPLEHNALMLRLPPEYRVDMLTDPEWWGRTYLPRGMHTRQESTDGLLGAKQWSHAFTRYIGPLVPSLVLQERRDWREWWRDDYVIGRLSRPVGPLSIGAEAMQALLCWLRDGEHYLVICKRFRHSRGWLESQRRRATRIVRTHYLPYPARAEAR